MAAPHPEWQTFRYWASATSLTPNLATALIIDLGGATWVEKVEIIWKEWAEDYYLETSLDKDDDDSWVEVVATRGNQVDTNVLSIFFMCRYIRLRMTLASQVRPFHSMAGGQYICSIREVMIYLDKDRARLHPGASTVYWHYQKEYMIDGDEDTYWSTNINDEIFVKGFESTLDLALNQPYTNVEYIRVAWQRPVPEAFNFQVSLDRHFDQAPILQSGDQSISENEDGSKETLILDQKLSFRIFRIVISSPSMLYNEKFAAIREVLAHVTLNSMQTIKNEIVITMHEKDSSYLESGNMLLSGSGEETNMMAQNIAAIIDERSSTSWTGVTSTEGMFIIFDLRNSAAVKVGNYGKLRLRWGSSPPQQYKVVLVQDGELDEPDEYQTLLQAPGTTDVSHDVIFATRYIVLDVTFAQNANAANIRKALSIQDFSVIEYGDNIMMSATESIVVPSEWIDKFEHSAHVPAGTEELVPERFESSTPTHLPGSALDGSFTSWFGAAFGTIQTMLEIDMGTRISIDVVKAYWRFAGRTFTMWGKQKDSDPWRSIFSVTDNAEDCFITTRQLNNNERLRYIQVEIAIPHVTYSGQPILGLRELEFYSFSDNIANSDSATVTSPQTDDATAMKAIDGLPDAWEANNVDAAELIVDVGAVTTLLGFEIEFLYYVREVQFYYSQYDVTDATDWHSLTS